MCLCSCHCISVLSGALCQGFMDNKPFRHQQQDTRRILSITIANYVDIIMSRVFKTVTRSSTTIEASTSKILMSPLKYGHFSHI